MSIRTRKLLRSLAVSVADGGVRLFSIARNKAAATAIALAVTAAAIDHQAMAQSVTLTATVPTATDLVNTAGNSTYPYLLPMIGFGLIIGGILFAVGLIASRRKRVL